VASHQDLANKQMTNNCEDSNQWRTSANKKKGGKNKKNQKNNKKNRPNKNKGKQIKKQQIQRNNDVKNSHQEKSLQGDITVNILCENSPVIQTSKPNKTPRQKTQETQNVKAKDSKIETEKPKPQGEQPNSNFHLTAKKFNFILQKKYLYNIVLAKVPSKMMSENTKAQKKSGDDKPKPPKYTNSKKQNSPVINKEELVDEEKRFFANNTLKMSKKSASLPMQNQFQSLRLDQKNQKPTKEHQEEESKLPKKVHQNWMGAPQVQKHANYINQENFEEDKNFSNLHAKPSSPKMWQNISSETQVSGMVTLSSANPQCGYNQSYLEMQQLQYDAAYYRELQKYIYEKFLYEKLSNDIENETKNITIMVNMIQKYRQSIKNELEKVAINAFEK
jgi:hypothetical protein